MAKPAKPVKQSTGSKSTAVAARVRPSRISKALKKVDRLKQTPKATSVDYSVRLVAQNAPIQLAGIIVSQTGTSTVVHHTKSGSSKELVSHIQTATIVEQTGGIGMPSQITYVGDHELLNIKSAKVTEHEGFLSIVDNNTGDVTTVFRRPGYILTISGAAESGSKDSDKPRKKFK
jgi:hypothetical protein